MDKQAITAQLEEVNQKLQHMDEASDYPVDEFDPTYSMLLRKQGALEAKLELIEAEKKRDEYLARANHAFVAGN